MQFAHEFRHKKQSRAVARGGPQRGNGSVCPDAHEGSQKSNKFICHVAVSTKWSSTSRSLIGAFLNTCVAIQARRGSCGALCKFALPSAQFTTIYRRPESMAMLGWRNKKSRTSDVRRAQQRYARNESSGGDVQALIAELRSVPREKLADTVFLLSMAAKQQSERIRQSIKERAEAEVEFDPPPNGDLAAYLAEEAVSILRHHETDVPTFMDILSNRSCDVGFTVEQRDAVSMLAAMIREQRLEGILEGLRLAGLLNKSPKNRHDDLGS